MKEKNNEQDKHLQSPGEANTEKHINFLKEEEESARQRTEEEQTDSPFYVSTNNPYQRLNNGSVVAAVTPLPDEEAEKDERDENNRDQGGQ